MRGPIFVGRAAVGRTILGPGRNPGSAGVLVIGPGLLNGDFETLGAGGADVFADWQEVTAGTSTVNAETSVVHGGSRSCRLAIDASGSVAQLVKSLLTVGHRYSFALWAKSSAGTPTLKVGTATAFATLTLSPTWTAYSGTFTADLAAFRVQSGTAASVSLYLDDLALYDLGA